MINAAKNMILSWFMLMLLFTLLFTVTVYAGEGLVYYNGEATEYKTYTDENGVLYIPFYMLADFYNGNIVWNEANQEAVLNVPVTEEGNTGANLEVRYYARYKVKTQSDSFEVFFTLPDGQDIGNETEKYNVGQTFIKDERLMVPAFTGGEAYTFLPANVRGELTLVGWNMGDGNLNYIDFLEPDPGNIDEKYKKYMIDRDKWILPSDTEYIIDFKEYGAAEKGVMFLALKGKDGQPITLELPVPMPPDSKEAIEFRNEGTVLNGILVKFGYTRVRYLFGKESVMNVINNAN